ncbi:hypothetical protein Salat_0167500 [Sesamum alatum]|uniref:ZF-HD dimerization-type domain-containing protein n=1 Tax=Sesamum alatum TaxID=300844 RepID=A0AAE2CXL7_9LAMI|nr:hypothetical protein Salat_0167500 [Sesamum alatum]
MGTNNISQEARSEVLVMYRKCLHNHATTTIPMAYIVDGCGLFDEASGPNDMVCATCRCHRNFHRGGGGSAPVVVDVADSRRQRRRQRQRQGTVGVSGGRCGGWWASTVEAEADGRRQRRRQRLRVVDGGCRPREKRRTVGVEAEGEADVERD